MTNASHPTDPIAQLWRHARAWLAEMLCDFISPAHVARTIAHHARIAFHKRLQLLELLVLKLLLIEAARVFQARPCKPMPAGSQRSSAIGSPEPSTVAVAAQRTEDRRLPARLGEAETASLRRRAHAEHPDLPITWRVRFHTPGRRQNTPAPTLRAPPRAPACAQTLALRLARRFEALRRVIADPRRAIAALARKLHALAGAARAFAHAIALASPRQGGGLLFANAIVYARDASMDLPCDTS